MFYKTRTLNLLYTYIKKKIMRKIIIFVINIVRLWQIQREKWCNKFYGALLTQFYVVRLLLRVNINKENKNYELFHSLRSYKGYHLTGILSSTIYFCCLPKDVFEIWWFGVCWQLSTDIWQGHGQTYLYATPVTFLCVSIILEEKMWRPSLDLA